jgi:hypothetical protein
MACLKIVGHWLQNLVAVKRLAEIIDGEHGCLCQDR